MTSEDTYRARAREAIEAVRKGELSQSNHSPLQSGSQSTNSSVAFDKARENSIEVYDDNFKRNTILTRTARMRKFKFYQFKPIQDSPSTPKTYPSTNNQSPNSPSIEDGNKNSHSVFTSSSPETPILLTREDVLDGSVALNIEQSKESAELDQKIVELEKQLSDLNQKGNDVDNLDEIFALVNKKNDLIRRQMQLNIIEKEKALERANDELTKELRSLMVVDDSRKTKAQLKRQQLLYDRSLALVNKRNELVHHMDVQERGIDEDNALKANLQTVISNTISQNRSKNIPYDQNCVIQ